MLLTRVKREVDVAEDDSAGFDRAQIDFLGLDTELGLSDPVLVRIASADDAGVGTDVLGGGHC